jgi:hypothetical protein
MDAVVSVFIAATLQLGALLWFLSGMRSDVRNLAANLDTVQTNQNHTQNLAYKLKGTVEGLPCGSCRPR